MKKILAIIPLVFVIFALAACNGESYTLEPTQTQNENNPTSIVHEEPSEPAHEWTIEELGATIEAAGEFWNKWWASHHTFEWEHIDDSRRNWQPWDETITLAHHPLSRGFAVILPSSGFVSFDDVGTHLSQFYTQAWIDTWTDVGVFTDPIVSMIMADGTIAQVFGIGGIEEYDGELFVFIQTEWSARPDWRTATHTLIEQDGNRTVVETVVSTHIDGYFPDYEMPTITYRFTLTDGKIESGVGQLEPGVQSGLVTENGESIFVQFNNLGFSIEFPAFWDGRFGLIESYVDFDFGVRHFVEVYHIATREEFDGIGGTIFTLGISPQMHYTHDGELPIMAGGTIILAQVGGSTYFVNFPSDIEHNYNPNSETGTEYLKMVGYFEPSHWQFLMDSFMFIIP